jgi:hypothetical protein
MRRRHCRDRRQRRDYDTDRRDDGDDREADRRTVSAVSCAPSN